MQATPGLGAAPGCDFLLLNSVFVMPAKAGIHEHRPYPSWRKRVFMGPGLRRDDDLVVAEGLRNFETGT
jgi:hypothetical protein